MNIKCPMIQIKIKWRGEVRYTDTVFQFCFCSCCIHQKILPALWETFYFLPINPLFLSWQNITELVSVRDSVHKSAHMCHCVYITFLLQWSSVCVMCQNIHQQMCRARYRYIHTAIEWHTKANILSPLDINVPICCNALAYNLKVKD